MEMNLFETNKVTPEVILPRLNKLLIDTTKGCKMFGKKDDIDTRLREIYKKTYITEKLFDNNHIVVSGLQGVGKTTLVRFFMDIEEDILPETLDIGEKLAVIIGEGTRTKYEYSVKYIKDDMTIVDENITKDQFLKRSMEPEDRDIILRLRTPTNSETSNKHSFILLPGIDQNESKWNDLTKHTMNYAKQIILVMNETSSAHEDNNVFIKKTMKELESIKPIIALSFSDQTSDYNNELKNNIFETFKFRENEKDRIICTGTDKKNIEIWKNELSNSLKKYCSDDKITRLQQLNNMDNIICDEMMIVVEDIKALVHEEFTGIEVNEYKGIEMVNDILIEKKDEAIKYFRNAIEKELDEVYRLASKIKREYIINEPKHKKIIDALSSNELKKTIEFEEFLIEIWERAVVAKYGIEEDDNYSKELLIYFNAINNTIENIVPTYNGESSESVDMLIGINKDHINNINGLISASQDLERIEIQTYIESIEKIPLLITETVLISNRIEIKDSAVKKVSELKVDLSKMENINFINFKDVNNKRSNLIKGLGAAIGVDGLDGNLDGLKKVFETVGITASQNMLNIAFPAIGAAFLCKEVVKKLNYNDKNKDYVAEMALGKVKEQLVESYCTCFNEFMNNNIEYYMKKVRVAYNVDNELGRLSLVERNVANLKEVAIEMREAIEGRRLLLE